MKVITTTKEMQEIVQTEKNNGKSIGFVATMGFLHDGHLHLIEKAKEVNELVVLSIFVNPLQFGPNEDFDQYPRNGKQDEQIAREQGVDLLFSPSTEEMYPNEPAVTVSVLRRTNVLCGKSRPGHFDGVATVLTKLFHIVMPDHAYFGIKDAQQVAVVEGLIEDFNFSITLVPCQTVREKDGLAKSSRNVYLTTEERIQASSIYDSLQSGKAMIQSGERNPAQVKNAVVSLLKENVPLGDIDYLELLAYPELESLTEVTGKVILAAAVKFRSARLIDNIVWSV